ncbi:hypothetical protein VTG60DRAFT_3495 [Thermothelomyces hinnuleus]
MGTTTHPPTLPRHATATAGPLSAETFHPLHPKINDKAGPLPPPGCRKTSVRSRPNSWRRGKTIISRCACPCAPAQVISALPGLASASRFPACSGSLLLSAHSPGATLFTWSSVVSRLQRYRPERGGPRREWGTMAPLDPVFRVTRRGGPGAFSSLHHGYSYQKLAYQSVYTMQNRTLRSTEYLAYEHMGHIYTLLLPIESVSGGPFSLHLFPLQGVLANR